jgi:hypothetical protein
LGGVDEEAKSDRLYDTAERGREGQRGAERGREGQRGPHRFQHASIRHAFNWFDNKTHAVFQHELDMHLT